MPVVKDRGEGELSSGVSLIPRLTPPEGRVVAKVRVVLADCRAVRPKFLGEFWQALVRRELEETSGGSCFVFQEVYQRTARRLASERIGRRCKFSFGRHAAAGGTSAIERTAEPANNSKARVMPKM